MRTKALVGVAILGFLGAPSAFWLNYSTVRVMNTGSVPVPSVTLKVCSEIIKLGELPAGSSTARVLPKCGENTLTISSGPTVVCNRYIEGSLHHVRAWFSSPSAAECDSDLPLFSPFALIRLLWSAA